MRYPPLSSDRYERLIDILQDIGTWGRFRLICWQNKVSSRQERDLYKVPHRRRFDGTTSGELSGSIKSLAISHRYGRAILLCHVRRHRQTLPPTAPSSPPAHPTYISRVRGETSISLDQSLIRPETPNTHKAKFAILTRALFFLLHHTYFGRCHCTPRRTVPARRERNCIGNRRFAN